MRHFQNHSKPSIFRNSKTVYAISGFLTVILSSCGGCGGEGGGEASTAQPEDSGVTAEAVPQDGSLGEDQLRQLLDANNRLQDQINKLKQQINKQTGIGDQNNQITNCGQINPDGSIVSCSKDQDNQLGNTPLGNGTIGGGNGTTTAGNGALSGLSSAKKGTADTTPGSGLVNSAASSGLSGTQSKDTDGPPGRGGRGGTGSGIEGPSGTANADYTAPKSSEFANGEMGKMAQSGGGGGAGGSKSGAGGDSDSGYGRDGAGSGQGNSATRLTFGQNSQLGTNTAATDQNSLELDMESYLKKIHPTENLFKVIERRYTNQALSWAKEDVKGDRL